MDTYSPLSKYEKAIANGEFQEDAAQAQVVRLLDELFHRLMANPPSSRAGWLSRWRKKTVDPQQGLYVWGGVGRGKTMLMDLFYDCLPPQRRMRMHFHRFMRRVHQGLAQWTGTSDPLRKVAADIAAEGDVLCFDEFFVSDIGDAMILAEVLDALLEHGVTLVATSNVEPSHLYENGLQRRRFLPAIDLLYAHTRVEHMPDGIDFRLRALEQAEIYHFPLDTAAERGLAQSFAALAPDTVEPDVDLQIEGRVLRARFVADDVVWFDFPDLCEGPRSQNDYIELAMVYHAVLLSNVPQLAGHQESAARRFISLVDEFYDHGVKLIISAAVPITELYQGERLRFEFERTQSRLLEMQSHDYLAGSHRAGVASAG
ncbi:MAG: cell division protein ZapE [Pseudomonadales bacterium]|jgi:cell division protein ZapE|nr:cell division protein ZapE [Pseudomonadales bacterium]